MNPQIDRIHYVYILADTDDKPFYVGKGVGGRASAPALPRPPLYLGGGAFSCAQGG